MTAVHEHQATRISLRTVTVEAGQPLSTVAEPERPVGPPPPRLVGRAAELDQLVVNVQSPPAVIVLEGEAGIGKTRLVSELCNHPALRDRLFLLGVCQSIREPFPLGPVLEAVRGLNQQLPGAALSPVTGALCSLLPELRDWLPDPPERLDSPVAERHRLFRGLVELLAAACPATLVLEDVHWADPQTVDFLRYLLVDPPVGLSLVITYRAEEIDPVVRALAGKLPPSVTRCHLALEPLDKTQTGQLAAAIAEVDQVSDEFASYLCERTGGLPFAIEQVMALLWERGVTPGDQQWSRQMLDELGVPVALRDHIQERATLLPAQVRSLLEVLAVMRYPATEDEIAQVTGQPAAEVAVGLCDGIRAGLLVDAGLRVGFRHALAAQAIYDGVPGPRRRELHNRTADVLSSTSGERPLGRIAYHLQQAGRTAEWIVVAEQAADRAVELGNYDEAARLLEEVLRQASPEPEVMGRLAIKLGWATTEVLRVTTAPELLDRVLAEDLPRSVRGELQYLAGVLIDQHNLDAERLLPLMRQAVENLPNRPDLRARALMALGLSQTSQPLSQRKRWLDRSLATLPEIPDQESRVFLLGKITAGLVDMGHPQWWELMDQLRSLTPHGPRTPAAANAWYSVGAAACFTGHHQLAGELLNGARDGATACRSQRMELFARGGLAAYSYDRGAWSGLERTLAELIEQTVAYPRCRLLAVAVAGSLALARGQVESAEQQLIEAIGDRIDGSSYSVAIATAGRIRLALARGEPDTALTVAEAYLRAARPGHPLWPIIYRALPWLVEAHLAAGQLAQARTLILRCWRELRKRAAPLAPAALRHARGLLAQASGEPVTAAYHFLTAGQRYELRNCPYEAAQVREQAAQAMLAAGRLDGIELPLREALIEYDRLGANWDLGRAARLARSHGVSVPARHRGGHRGYGDALTPREREVALLAASGRTNKEIAGELFVSAETVKKHLQAVMRKLGVQSRVALARRLPT